jgi:ATP phosphoribosyltransferase
LTEQFFKPFDEEQGVTTTITEVSGSVEAACGLGLADAVVDLVETGTTMKVS